MKRLLTMALALAAGVLLHAQDFEVNAVITNVFLHKDGSAMFSQEWEVYVGESITEWYIPIGNLNGRKIHHFQVTEYTDKDTTVFVDEMTWNSNRSISAKAYRSGIATTSDGIELCWGVGSPGYHTFEITYEVEGFVQSHDEFDGFNWMFINPEIGVNHVRLYIQNKTGLASTWSKDNEDARAWVFGVTGDPDNGKGIYGFDEDGDLYFSTDDLPYDESVIILMRFKKGIFEPTQSSSKTWDELYDEAMEGSDYGIPWWKRVLWFLQDLGWVGLFIVALPFILIYLLIRKIWLKIAGSYRKDVFGVKKIDTWYRDTPLGGSILGSYSLMTKGDRLSTLGTDNLIGAYFLNWVMNGYIRPEKDPKKDTRINLVFTKSPEEIQFAETMEQTIYRSALEAAGDNKILEKNEFKRWSEKNVNTVMGWNTTSKVTGEPIWKKFSQEERKHVPEFKNFLSTFTIVNEREVPEVGLWKDYMVFAQLFGIADQVSKSMAKLFPAEFDEYCRQTGLMDTMTSYTILNSISTSSYSMVSAARAKHNAEIARSSGGGGWSSRGGGGGFSGGGRGGGGR